MKMKSHRTRVTSSALSSAAEKQKTGQDLSNGRILVPSSHKVYGRQSSTEGSLLLHDRKKPTGLTRESDHKMHENNRKVREVDYKDHPRRRHSVDSTGIKESGFITKSTQTSHPNVKPAKSLTRSKSVVLTSKPNLEPRPILKCTGSVSERVEVKTNSEENRESDCVAKSAPDVKCCYRLPEKRPAKLRKSVSFREDSHKIKLKDYSRTYGSPPVPVTDDIFSMDDMKESLVDF